MITQREAFVKALKAEGWIVEYNTHRRHIKLSMAGDTMYIGSHGSLRRGRTLTESIPVSAKRKHQLLVAGGYYHSPATQAQQPLLETPVT